MIDEGVSPNIPTMSNLTQALDRKASLHGVLVGSLVFNVILISNSLYTNSCNYQIIYDKTVISWIRKQYDEEMKYEFQTPPGIIFGIDLYMYMIFNYINVIKCDELKKKHFWYRFKNRLLVHDISLFIIMPFSTDWSLPFTFV